MAIRPIWLNGVGANPAQASELKSLRSKWPVRIFVEVSHDVHFAFATGARTMTPEFFKMHKLFAAVFPPNRQLISNLLNVQGFHSSETLI